MTLHNLFIALAIFVYFMFGYEYAESLIILATQDGIGPRHQTSKVIATLFITVTWPFWILARLATRAAML